VIRLAVLAGSALFLSTTVSSAAPPLGHVSTAADAVVVRITIPDQTPVGLGQISWPDNSSAEL